METGKNHLLESGKEVGPLEDVGENLGTMLKQESTESGGVSDSVEMRFWPVEGGAGVEVEGSAVGGTLCRKIDKIW